MKDWKKEFDEKFKGYWRGEAMPDELKFFISKVEADAIARAISDDLQRQLTEERKLDAEQMCMCTPEINRNEAYERAAKVAEDFYKTAMDFGHEEEVGKRIGPVIRSLKDD